VPCGQFFNQEPSSNGAEIANAIRWVRPGNDFTPNFPIFVRSEVNGEGRIPLYKLVTSRCASAMPQFFPTNVLLYTPVSSEDIRWNFEKILFGKDGQPYRRYSNFIEPFQLEEDIQFLLAKES